LTWLSYSDDEVTRFHPEFETIAETVLQTLGIAQDYRWHHHLHVAGVDVIPDFVLVERATNRWRLVVEIKRSRAAVYSTRNQIQAKGYAEANKSMFALNRPLYFSVTNLETSLLFALNEARPPKECRIKDMTFDSGSFAETAPAVHKARFQAHLTQTVQFLLAETKPEFESVWPAIARDMVNHAESLTYDPRLDLGSASSVPAVVSSYFAGNRQEIVKRELLLRCLAAEYVGGMLRKYKHQDVNSLPPPRRGVAQFATALEALRRIDFSGLFEPGSPALYRELATEPKMKQALESYLETIVRASVRALAQSRDDSPEFPEVLLAECYPLSVQDQRGKAQTDPELAYLLAAASISSNSQRIFDPGCGDGSLLSAAYDVLHAQGRSHAQALEQIEGIDPDGLAIKIAVLRLALKAPFAIALTDPCHLECADMFSSRDRMGNADVVLMNPPFKRYEAQGDSPIPKALRDHYRTQIEALGGNVETDSGQANIYNLYVEFVVKAAKGGATLGIVLDNRWYHNSASAGLRELLLKNCSVVAVIEYPHSMYFKDWMIATSLLLLRRETAPEEHDVQFIRAQDPRRADFALVAHAIRGQAAFPADWRVKRVRQSALTIASWKKHFSGSLTNEYRANVWPTLDDLFTSSRRGSLEKEGGGISVFEFPFGRTNYGPKRRLKPAPRNPFQTLTGDALTRTENAALREAAAGIPDQFRGYAIQNSDALSGYTLSVHDVSATETLEAPAQRTAGLRSSYFSSRRRAWDLHLDAAVTEFKANAHAAAYIDAVENSIGLDEVILSRSELWNTLREPFAGELIIPRKLRAGHRVHINPFALAGSGRQVRLSSNFFSYYQCIAVDVVTGLDRTTSLHLICAFLMSSFGQLQFEMEGNNREGARSLEGSHLSKIKIFDPRWVRSMKRAAILNAWKQLPYPVPTDRAPIEQPELARLDVLFSEEIAYRDPGLDPHDLVSEVHQTLFDWLEVRNS